MARCASAVALWSVSCSQMSGSGPESPAKPPRKPPPSPMQPSACLLLRLGNLTCSPEKSSI